VGSYDPKRELIIDPILEYSTYVGGSNIEAATQLPSRKTRPPSSPEALSPRIFDGTSLQPNHGGPDDFSRDAFVAKISADGSTLLYATYWAERTKILPTESRWTRLGCLYHRHYSVADFPVTPGSF